MAEAFADPLQARTRVVLLEPNDGLRGDLARAIDALGFAVEAFGEIEPARAAIAHGGVELVVADLDSPGLADWLETPTAPAAPARLLLSGDPRRASEPVGGPQTTWLRKPFSVRELETGLLSCLETRASGRVGDDFVDPVLRSCEPHFEALLERARHWARGAVALNLDGELGTGRRALARAVHAWSPRQGEPHACLEATALGSLARETVRDAVEQTVAHARAGTLVVVEPAELDAIAREALLGALRGGDQGEASGPRILTVSRLPFKDWAADVLAPELRYRLEGLSLRLPGFRERPSDQAGLIHSTLRRVTRELGLAVPNLPEAVLEGLARDGFPGNRVGLESRLRGALLRAGAEEDAVARWLEAETQPVPPAPAAPARPAPESLDLKTLERETIVRALAYWDGNRTRASESLGISVRTLRNKIRDYGLR